MTFVPLFKMVGGYLGVGIVVISEGMVLFSSTMFFTFLTQLK